MKRIALKLFVTGQSSYGNMAIENLNELMRNFSEYQFEVEVIDVLENPQLASTEKILATPTLIKRQPPPACRIIGDLSQKERVLTALNLQAQDDANSLESRKQ